MKTNDEKRIYTLKEQDKIRRDLQEKRASFKHEAKEMGDKLKGLVGKEAEQTEAKKQKRSKEILGVFAKHNFYAGGFSPEELRSTLEDLGPTYVKIGQIMSSRADVLPQRYCDELCTLRQHVKPLDADIAKAVIEEETGKSIDELFEEFRDEPVGSASIAQAHYGKLRDGREVVVKVQRPMIGDIMRSDFVLLKKLAKAFNTVTERDKGEQSVDLFSTISEMEKVTEEELDFRIEAENTRFFRENCIEDETKISCPTIIDELTTERILTMTYVDGVTLAKKEKVAEAGHDLNDIGRNIVENYVHQVLDVGTFHADPHQGNIMVTKDGVPNWIDFGMVGHVTDKSVSLMQDIIFSLLDRDLDTLVNAITSIGAASPDTDRNALTQDLDSYIDKYMNVRSLNDIDMAALMQDISDVCAKHSIKMPGEFTMLVRSAITIEGVIEDICPSLNLFEIFSTKFLNRVKENNDIEEKIKAAGKEALASTKKAAKIPALTADTLNHILKGRTKVNVELSGYEEAQKSKSQLFLYIILAVFSCVLFIGSCLLCMTDMTPVTPAGIPLLSVVGFIFSIGLGVYTVKKIKEKTED